MILVNKLVQMLPQELRKAFWESPKRGSEAQLAMKVIVAGHLWQQGFRQVKFEKLFTLPDGKYILVDVYGGEQNLCVECETRPIRSDIKDRIKQIKAAHPAATHVLAVPDYLGYEAQKFEDLTEVWVVSRDARVLKPKEWVEWRERYLIGDVDAERIGLLLKCYAEEAEMYACWKREKQSLLSELSSYLAALATSATGDVSLIQGLSINWNLEHYIEGPKTMMELFRAELLYDIVELANRLLMLTTPYKLKLEDDGTLIVTEDIEAMDWLGHDDSPKISMAECRRRFRTTIKELEKISKTIKPKIKSYIEKVDWAKLELINSIKKGKITIHNKRLQQTLNQSINCNILYY